MTATKEPPALTPDISSRPIKKAQSRSPFAIVDLYKSAVGKKWVMALTGVGLMGFVFFHMVGNLKMYLGPEEFNHYAEFLRELLVPILPRTVLLWLLRTLLLLALFLQLRVKPWLAVVVALAAAFAIHAAFYKLLRVSLPWGVLPILY